MNSSIEYPDERILTLKPIFLCEPKESVEITGDILDMVHDNGTVRQINIDSTTRTVPYRRISRDPCTIP